MHLAQRTRASRKRLSQKGHSCAECVRQGGTTGTQQSDPHYPRSRINKLQKSFQGTSEPHTRVGSVTWKELAGAKDSVQKVFEEIQRESQRKNRELRKQISQAESSMRDTDDQVGYEG